MANTFTETDPDKLAPPPPAYGDPYDSDSPLPPPTPKRRSSESSTERSLYNEKAGATAGAAAAFAAPASTTAPPPQSSAPGSGGERTLHIYAEGALHRHSAICRKNGAGQSVAEYYCEASTYQPSKPDLILRAGADATGPVRAAAKFRWSRTLHLCLGDPDGPGPHTWEAMANKSLVKHSTYALRISRPQGVQHLTWERARDLGENAVEEAVRKELSYHNYRIVDGDAGRVVAVYQSNALKSWKKRGRLVFAAPHDPELEHWVLLGTLGLLEKARRRQHARAANSGGSGGWA